MRRFRGPRWPRRIAQDKRDKMPRPNKATRRQKINAAIAYKRGDRKEAYDLWRKASDTLREMRQKKRTRHLAKPEEAATESAEPAEATE